MTWVKGLFLRVLLLLVPQIYGKASPPGLWIQIVSLATGRRGSLSTGLFLNKNRCGTVKRHFGSSHSRITRLPPREAVLRPPGLSRPAAGGGHFHDMLQSLQGLAPA